MSKKLCLIIGLAILAGTTLGGCASAAHGPWTPANAWSNWEPESRAVGWILAASMLYESHIPFNAESEVDGWAIRPSFDFNSDTTPRVHMSLNIDGAIDTTKGVGYWLVGDTDWGDWGDAPRPLLTNMEHWMMVTIREPDGPRVAVGIWRLLAGQSYHMNRTAVSRAFELGSTARTGPDRVFIGETQMLRVEYNSTNHLKLAKQIIAQSRTTK